MEQNCSFPTPSEAARGAARGSGPLGLGEAVKWVLSAILRIADSVYNAALIENAEVHATVGGSRAEAITAGTPKEIHHNKLKDPVLVHVRAETANGISAYMYLSTEDAASASASRAQISRYGVDPAASLILPPNARLFVDVTPAAGATASNVVVSVLPLKGAQGLFRE